MNIFTKIKDGNESIDHTWQCDKCTNIHFIESPVLKMNETNYFHLKFKYKFTD